MKIERAAKQLEALGNPTRLRVYRTLVRAGGAGLPVGRLQKQAEDRGLDAVSSPASIDLRRMALQQTPRETRLRKR